MIPPPALQSLLLESPPLVKAAQEAAWVLVLTARRRAPGPAGTRARGDLVPATPQYAGALGSGASVKTRRGAVERKGCSWKAPVAAPPCCAGSRRLGRRGPERAHHCSAHAPGCSPLQACDPAELSRGTSGCAARDRRPRARATKWRKSANVPVQNPAARKPLGVATRCSPGCHLPGELPSVSACRTGGDRWVWVTSCKRPGKGQQWEPGCRL